MTTSGRILEAQDPWIIVPVFVAIGMNNAGRRNLKVKLLLKRVEPFFSTAMRHIWRIEN
jgi:3-methyladenine DNA glycosylase/8-oxoguanine DNA glycosylase